MSGFAPPLMQYLIRGSSFLMATHPLFRWAWASEKQQHGMPSRNRRNTASPEIALVVLAEIFGRDFFEDVLGSGAGVFTIREGRRGLVEVLKGRENRTYFRAPSHHHDSENRPMKPATQMA